MKTHFFLLFAFLSFCSVSAQTLTEFQKRQAAQQVKQVLKDYESAFCLHTNPAVVSIDEKNEARNRMWASVRSDARFENDLVPNNKGAKLIDFNEYQRLAFINYKSGRGLSYGLEWEEAEFKPVANGYMMFFYGSKTLMGTYQGQRPLRLEGEPCRAGVFIKLNGSSILEAKIGLMDTDLSAKGSTFSLTENTNPLDFLTLPEAVDKLAAQVAQQLPANVVKKISIETFSYDGKKVLNDFSHQVTGNLKSSLTQHNPDIEMAVISRSVAFEPYVTLRGSYQKAGNFLKLSGQLYNTAEEPVGKPIISEILLINLQNAAIEPAPELVEEATRLQEIMENRPSTAAEPRAPSIPIPVPVNAGGLRLEINTNKGNGPQSFAENDTMSVAVRANKPCIIRLIYRDAANNLVLLRNKDFNISEYQVNRWVEIPESFVCAAPFGVEMLLGFATTGLFSPLRTEERDGFTFIKDDLKKVKEASSEPRAMKNIGVSVAEQSIQITTKKK